MMPPQDIVRTATNDGAAIILWISCGASAYFLKRFADSVDGMRKEIQRLNVWVARIGLHVGIEDNGGAKE